MKKVGTRRMVRHYKPENPDYDRDKESKGEYIADRESNPPSYPISFAKRQPSGLLAAQNRVPRLRHPGKKIRAGSQNGLDNHTCT
jgi:hypothetical protein